MQTVATDEGQRQIATKANTRDRMSATSGACSAAARETHPTAGSEKKPRGRVNRLAQNSRVLEHMTTPRCVEQPER